MKKKIITLFVLFGFLLAFHGTAVEAYHGSGECLSGHGPFSKAGWGRGAEEAYACPIVEKFMTKAHFYLENQKEIGLSEDQVNSIKELKLERKKSYVRQMSEHQIFILDITHKLSQPKVDVEGIGAMIDQQIAPMAASAKETVAAYAKLKSILSEEQRAKAKELWLAQKQ